MATSSDRQIISSINLEAVLLKKELIDFVSSGDRTISAHDGHSKVKSFRFELDEEVDDDLPGPLYTEEEWDSRTGPLYTEEEWDSRWCKK